MMDTAYKEFRNAIPINTVKSWESTLMDSLDWRFVGWSGPAHEPYRHWACYPELDGLVRGIWNIADATLRDEGINLTPERVIANLYNHGDSSWLHRDSDDEVSATVIVFLNTRWDADWGGDFALFDDDDEILWATAPTPGKIIAFKGNVRHGARPVSREAPYPRFGLAFQCNYDSNLQRLSQVEVSPLQAAKL